MIPRKFILCFDNHAAHGKVWAVRQGRKWRITRRVLCDVPTETVYRGVFAKQPRAFQSGRGVVRGNQHTLRITER